MSLELRNDKINYIKNLENLSFDDLLLKKASRSTKLLKESMGKVKNTPEYDPIHKLFNQINDTIGNINNEEYKDKKNDNIEKLEKLISNDIVTKVFEKEKKQREEVITNIFGHIQKNIEKLSSLDENHPEIENLIDIEDLLSRTIDGDTGSAIFTSDLNSINKNLKEQKGDIERKIKGFGKLEEKAPIKKEYSTPEIKTSSLDDFSNIFANININNNNERIMVQAQMLIEVLDESAKELELKGALVPHELISQVKDKILKQINIINSEKDPKKLESAQIALQETLDESYLIGNNKKLTEKTSSTDISTALKTMIQTANISFEQTPTYLRLKEKNEEFEIIRTLIEDAISKLSIENEDDERILKLEEMKLKIEEMFTQGLLHSIESIDTKALQSALENIAISEAEVEKENISIAEKSQDTLHREELRKALEADLAKLSSNKDEDTENGENEIVSEESKLGPALDPEFATGESQSKKPTTPDVEDEDKIEDDNKDDDKKETKEELTTEESLEKIFKNKEEILKYLSHYENRIDGEKVMSKIIEILRGKVNTISELEDKNFKDSEEFKNSLEKLLNKTNEITSLIEEYKSGKISEDDEFNHFKKTNTLMNQIPALVEMLKNFFSEKELELILDQIFNNHIYQDILSNDKGDAGKKLREGLIKAVSNKDSDEKDYSFLINGENLAFNKSDYLEEKDGDLTERIQKDESVEHLKITASTNSNQGTKKDTTVKVVKGMLDNLYSEEKNIPIKFKLTAKFKESQENAINAINEWLEEKGLDRDFIVNYDELVAKIEKLPSNQQTVSKSEEKKIEVTKEEPKLNTPSKEEKAEVPNKDYSIKEVKEVIDQIKKINLDKETRRTFKKLKLEVEKQDRFEKDETLRDKGIYQEEINNLYKDLYAILQNAENEKAKENSTTSTPSEKQEEINSKSNQNIEDYKKGISNTNKNLITNKDEEKEKQNKIGKYNLIKKFQGKSVA